MPVRALPPLNPNYDPPQPWRCATHRPHDCGGHVVGAVGAVPCCAAGADAEQAAQDADRLRVAAFMATPEMRREVARELAWERRVS